MKNLFLLLLGCLPVVWFTACTTSIPEEKLTDAIWVCHSCPVSSSITEFKLSGDSAQLMSSMPFTFTGAYRLQDRDLTIRLDVGGSIQKRIAFFSPDSLRFEGDTSLFYRYDYEYRFPPVFSLIGIRTGLTVGNELDQRIESAGVLVRGGIALLKNEKGETVWSNGEYLKPLSELQWGESCFDCWPTPYIGVMIGEGIKLRDLAQLLGLLQKANNKHLVRLILYTSGPGHFEYFEDNIELWYEDAVIFMQNAERIKNYPPPPPPPPLPYQKTREYYLSQGAELIQINTSEEIDELRNNLSIKGKYLIGIGLDLSIEDYIRIKELTHILRKYKGYRIRTELRPDEQYK